MNTLTHPTPRDTVALLRHGFGLLLAAAALLAVQAAQAQPYVNVSVGGEFSPGVYGQIVLGNNPPPPVVNVHPVIVGHPVYAAPVRYMYVSPYEYANWGRHCARYGACGYPVHFVRVDERNHWWEHRNPYVRGTNYFYHRPPEYRHPGGHGDRFEDRGKGPKDKHGDKRQDHGYDKRGGDRDGGKGPRDAERGQGGRGGHPRS